MNHKDKLSDNERIARRKEASARYREKNLEKCLVATLKSQAKNPERKLEYDAAWRERQADHIKAQQLEYRSANRDRINAGTVAWQKENPEIFKAYQAKYRKVNASSIFARISIWRTENAERERLRLSKWSKDNPDLRRISSGARRARMRNQCGIVSVDIVKKLMLLQRGKCAVCRVGLSKTGNHLDHVMPLKLGGMHSDSNFQLLCPKCNLSKRAHHPIDFMQKKGFLL
jgi:5-methylcytosine-specific restriction endonuclease McrA